MRLHQGWFAEVRVYCLGLFAVVSCLKKENYTVPTKGLSLKLNMDARICLNYLPGCFAAPVVAQTMVWFQKSRLTHLTAHSKAAVDGWCWPSKGIKRLTMFSQIQPMDTTLLAAAKSRTDVYHSVVSTSPLLYLTHPTSQPLRRPLTLILPCPPNLQKKKQEGRQEESAQEQTRRDKPAPPRR